MELHMLTFIHLVVYPTTATKSLPKRALHIVRSRASSIKWEYPLLSLKSSSSFLRPDYLTQMPDGWLEARIRKVLRPATSTQVFLIFLGPRRKCWDGSHFSSKLPLHASHVALPN